MIHPRPAYQFASPAFRRLGYAFMLALLALALLFYRERTWILDIAFQTFLMANEGSLQVMVNRFGSALVQLLPLGAIRAGAPLPVVSILYSASFPLLYLGFYALTVKVLRNDLLGWAIVLLYTLVVYDAFYWATSEQQQGLGAVLAFFAYWLRFPAQEKPWMWGVSALGVVALAYYHPLIFLSFYFLWAFFALHFGRAIIGRAYLLLAGGMAAVLGAKSWLSANWYDAAKYSSFSDNLVALFPDYLSLPAHSKFLEHAFTIWWGFPLLLGIVTIFYAYHKKWLKLLLVWASCLGYLLLLHIGSPESEHRFYVEVNYMALAIFTGVPFLFDVARAIPEQRLLWGLALLVALRLFLIGAHHAPFRERWQWIERQLQAQEGGSRFYLKEGQAPMDTLLMSWGMPYESLIISKVRMGEAKTLLVHPDLAPFEHSLQDGSLFVTPFKTYPDSALSPRYFPLLAGPYRPLQAAGQQPPAEGR